MSDMYSDPAERFLTFTLDICIWSCLIMELAFRVYQSCGRLQNYEHPESHRKDVQYT